MLHIYDTSSFTEEYRIKRFNGARQFNRCECCGYETKPGDGIGIVYRDRYKQILCDRCTDNKDGITVWSDNLAKQSGLPPYPESINRLSH